MNWKVTAFVLSALCATPLQAQVTTAVLSDGSHLDVTEATQVGTFMIHTEFGVLRSQGEQVSLLIDGDQEVRLLEPLRNLDYVLWVQRLTERGHLKRLMAEDPPVEHRGVLLEALRIWGQRLDSLSPKVKRENRVDELVKQLMKADSNRMALLVGALEVEISPSINHDRRLTVAQWRKILDTNNSSRRWAAMRIAAVLDDANTELDLLQVGLKERDLWVALEAGRALQIIDPGGATYRWAYEMVTSRSSFEKRRAAMQLASWSRNEPDTAKHMAARVRSHSFFQECNSLPYRPSIDRYRYRTRPSGAEGTFHSVLAIGSPSRLVMLKVADVIQRVGESHQKPAPAPEALPKEAIAADLEKAQAEAWRKQYMGR